MYMHKDFERNLTRREYNNLHDHLYNYFNNENRTLREIKTLLKTSCCEGQMGQEFYSLEYDTVANIIINPYGRKNTRIYDSEFCNNIRNRINKNHGTEKYYFLYNIGGERMERLVDGHMMYRIHYLEKRYYSLENIYLRTLNELEELNNKGINIKNNTSSSQIQCLNNPETNKESAKIKIEDSLYIKERQEECEECMRNSPYLNREELHQRDLCMEYDNKKRRMEARYEAGGVNYNYYKTERKELYESYKATGCFDYYKK